MIELVCIDPKRVHEIWPKVESLLKAATEKCGSWSVGSIQAEALCGLQLLWITWDGARIRAAATTKLILEERGLVCLAVACGGEDRDWPARFLPIEAYARNEGCVSTRIQGRPGWARVFKDYKTEWVTLEKRLD